MNDTSVLEWLTRLRYTFENYENVRPLSSPDLAVVLNRQNVEMAKVCVVENRLSGQYENIWECRNAKSAALEIKHADICRVSTVFQECGEAEPIVPVTVDDLHMYVTTDVLQWISELWVSSEEEEEEFETFSSAAESKSNSAIQQTPLFPVEGVELRKKNETRCSRSTTFHATSTKPAVKNVDRVSQYGIPPRQTSNISKDQGHISVMKHNEGENIYNLGDTKNGDAKVKQLDNRKVTSKKSKLKDEDTKVEKSRRLLKFLKRRSKRDLLEKKGIIKNEEIFGNTLVKLHQKNEKPVPNFVSSIIDLIEVEKNITSEYLYRISGNLASVQTIRFHIDKDDIKILDKFKNDPDVLTGALKLFFRELKEPVIPIKIYDTLLDLLDKPVPEGKIRNLVNEIETPHKETLLALIRHLLKVESYSDKNKMTIESLSICWGPSLLWTADVKKYNLWNFSVNVNKLVQLILNAYRHSETDTQTKHADESGKSTDKGFGSTEAIAKISPHRRRKLRDYFSKWKSDSHEKLHGSNQSLASTTDSDVPKKELKD